MSRVIGNYALGAMLGRGGTSEVYAAEHRFLGERAAVKILRAHLATGEFLAEARRTRAIRHPNVVHVLDFGIDDGAPYLVMERIDGESLAARLSRDGPLDEATVRRIGAGIADGMAAANALGIVHRDLKPANVMLAGDEPKVVDFGIGTTGPRMGTPAYMAPELVAGDVATPAADLWALGVILYEALTGSLPSEPPRACSPSLDPLIRACLDRQPGRRPPSMAAIARELRGELDERVTEAIAAPVAPRRPRRWIPVVIGAGVAATAMGAWQLASRRAAAGLPAGATAAIAVVDAAIAVDAALPAIDAPPAEPPADAATAIEIRSTPAGATVVIAGKRAGRTPVTLELALPADVELVRPGFRAARARVTAPGALEVHLVPLPRRQLPCPIPPCESLD